MKKLVFLLLFVTNVAYAVERLDEIVVTASKEPSLYSKTGKTINVIDHTIFEEYKPLQLTDAVHNVPGVYVKRLNGQSGLTTVKIRGMRSIDTKVLYNGIPLQDPSDPQGSANPLIGDLSSKGLEKVEVLSGASSTLWGSEAMGGVINIIPSREDKLKIGFEYGSNRTFTESIEVGKNGLSLEANHSDSSGFDHHDAYHHTMVSGGFNRDITDRIHMEVSILNQETEAMLNQAPVIEGKVLKEDVDDPNDRREYRLFHGGATTHLVLTEEVSFTNKVGFTDSDRRFVFLPNPNGTGFYSDGIFRGNDFTLEDLLTVKHSKNLSTTIGHQYERQWYELNQKDLREADQADAYSNDFFVEEQIHLGNLHFNLAGRENTHERSKNRATYDIAGSYSIGENGSKLRSHYGTSFREPSLYELYGAFLTSFGRFEVGNPNLSPERGKTFDIGCDLALSDKINIGGTFFHTSIRNKIDFAGFSYANIKGTDSTRGVEVYYEQYLIDGLSARTSYTFTDGDNLIDVPESLWDASLRYSKNKWTANLRARFTGRHKITVFNLDTFTVNNVNEDGNFTVDSTVSYKLNPDIEIYVRAENLLSEDYHEGGYRTPGATVYGGIQVLV